MAAPEDGTRDKNFLFSEGDDSEKRTWVIAGVIVSYSFVIRAICLTLLILCIALTLSLIILQSRSSLVSEEAQWRARVCLGRSCLRAGVSMSDEMNVSISPCEDFYEYACGQFEERSPLTSRLPYGVKKVLREKNKRKVLELLLHQHHFDEISSVNKLKTLFRTCKESEFQKDSSTKLFELITELGGWDLFGNFNRENWNFSNLFIKSRAEHRLPPIFGMMWYPKRNIINLSAPRFQADLDIYSEENETAVGKLSQLKKVITETLNKIKTSASPANKSLCGEQCNPEFIAEDVINFARNLSSLWKNHGFFKNRTLASISYLDNYIPSIDWKSLFMEMYGSAIINGNPVIYVPSDTFASELQFMLSNSNPSAINNYIMWDITYQYLHAMGSGYYVLYRELHKTSFGTHLKSRQDFCFEIVSQFMPNVLKFLFIGAHIGVDRVPNMQSFYSRINETFASGFDWMSDNSRQRTLQLLSEIKVDYGINELISSKDKLNSYYHDLQLDPKSFFANIVSIDHFRLLESRRKVDLLTNDIKGDDFLWVSSGSLSGVSVGFDFNANMLRVESAILQQPFFDEYLPEVVNMAAIGTIVMKSLNRPFIIRRTRKRRRDWWNLRDKAHFNNYEQCLLDNFRDHDVYLKSTLQYRTSDQHYGRHKKGSVKLNPDLARSYLISHHVAFSLAEKFLLEKANKNSKLIPSVGVLSTDQLFYLAYAQTQCQSMDATMAIMMNALMKLFPHHHMVNTFVYNSPHFRRSFGCERRHRQYSVRHCSL